MTTVYAEERLARIMRLLEQYKAKRIRRQSTVRKAA